MAVALTLAQHLLGGLELWSGAVSRKIAFHFSEGRVSPGGFHYSRAPQWLWLTVELRFPFSCHCWREDSRLHGCWVQPKQHPSCFLPSLHLLALSLLAPACPIFPNPFLISLSPISTESLTSKTQLHNNLKAILQLPRDKRQNQDHGCLLKNHDTQK